jgi:CelD/BcsL family acetyltransferase involved in cellulose biosynthesis
MSTGPPESRQRIVLEPVESLDALNDDWTRLAQASGNVFSTWEWASTWWRHFRRDRELLVHASRTSDGRLAAILPLYVPVTRPARVARFLGHGPADQLGPVCARADRLGAARALSELVEHGNIDLLLAELLPGDVHWSQALGGTVLRTEASPTLELDGWERYLAGRSANFRQQVRRRERRLRRGRMLTFRLTSDPSQLADDLAELFRLHKLRWGGESAFLKWRAFHSEFAAIALERGWLRLWFLELDGRSVAAWYGFRFAGVESYYQAGRDPTRSDDSIGFVLLAHSIREAANDGMREYRFLRGAEPFKQRFADGDPGLQTVAVAVSRRGRIAGAVVARTLGRDRARSLLARAARTR